MKYFKLCFSVFYFHILPKLSNFIQSDDFYRKHNIKKCNRLYAVFIEKNDLNLIIKGIISSKKNEKFR